MFSHTVSKNKLKLDKRVKYKTGNYKIPSRKLAEHINCRNIFLDLSPKAKETNAILNKRDLIKQGFFTAKETMNKTG